MTNLDTQGDYPETGNWRSFENFCWHDKPQDANDWAIWYYSNRDASLIEQSNAQAIEAELSQYDGGGDLHLERHNHWAVGYLDGVSVRVYKPGTDQHTKAYEAVCSIIDRLREYPCLDEEDYSNKETEATLENIDNELPSCVDTDKLPADWKELVYRELPDDEIRSIDDQGGFPSSESIQEVIMELWPEALGLQYARVVDDIGGLHFGDYVLVADPDGTEWSEREIDPSTCHVWPEESDPRDTEPIIIPLLAVQFD